MPSIPTDELMVLIVRTVEDYLRRTKGSAGVSGKYNGRPIRSHWALATSAISKASNGATAPGSGTAEILKEDSSGNLIRTGIEKTIKNRYENIQVEEDTLIRIKNPGGEWMLETADCGPMEEPPAELGG